MATTYRQTSTDPCNLKFPTSVTAGQSDNYGSSGFSGCTVNPAADGIRLSTFSGLTGNSGFSGATANLFPFASTVLGTSGYLTTSKSVKYTVTIKTGAVVTGCVLFAGLKMTCQGDAIGTDDDGVWFRHEGNGLFGNCWHLVVNIAGTDYVLQTSVAVAANTIYKLDIDVNSDRYAEFYINDAPVHGVRFGPLTAAVALYPFEGCHCWDTTGVRDVYYQRIEASRLAS
jgi:hypothetical protein